MGNPTAKGDEGEKAFDFKNFHLGNFAVCMRICGIKKKKQKKMKIASHPFAFIIKGEFRNANYRETEH